MEQDPNALIFQISEENGKSSLKLKFNSASEYNEWVKEIKIARRPRWEPESTKICNECKKEFTFFRRQHHCRNCGKVFCRFSPEKSADIFASLTPSTTWPTSSST